MITRALVVATSIVALQAVSAPPDKMGKPTAVPVFSDSAAGFIVSSVNESGHDALIPPGMGCHARVDGVREQDRGGYGGASRVKDGAPRVELINIVSDEKKGRPWAAPNPLPGTLGASHSAVFPLTPGEHKAAFQCAGSPWSDEISFYWVADGTPR
jgi:hypothetical protein